MSSGNNNNNNRAKIRAAMLAKIRKNNPVKKLENAFRININNNDPYFLIKKSPKNIILSRNSMIYLLKKREIQVNNKNKTLAWWNKIPWARGNFQSVILFGNRSIGNYAWKNVTVVRNRK